jgi:predicted nuclease with TOPRIM domain
MTRSQAPKDLLSRFADLGEEAMQRLSDVPGMNRLVEMTNQSRQRLDEMQKRLRGLDVLEERVNELERRVEALEGKPARKASAKPAAAKSTTPKATAPKATAPKASGATPTPPPSSPPPPKTPPA